METNVECGVYIRYLSFFFLSPPLFLSFRRFRCLSIFSFLKGDIAMKLLILNSHEWLFAGLMSGDLLELRIPF